MGTGDLTTVTSTLRELTLAPDSRGQEVYATTEKLMEVRNLADHQLAVHAAALDRLGVGKVKGVVKTKNLLIEMGAAPSVADRWLRVGFAMNRLQRLPDYAGDGVFSGERVDAIASGVAHIERRAPDGLCDEEKLDYERTLIGQALSGATPKQIGDKARECGNEVAADLGGLPAAEDRRLNEWTMTQTGDGRLAVRGDLDLVTGEKLVSAIMSLSKPRPEPDGSPDARTSAQARAEALEQMLDTAADHPKRSFWARPKTDLMVTIPVDTPDLGTLQWMGAISQATAKMLACDASVTEIVIDGETVPLQVGVTKRFFTPGQRRAILVRDERCIKCGGPAGWSHIHHARHWQDGGPTDIDNGCLLCPGCHAEVHAAGWEVVFGIDRHPWLVPPVTVDPQRRPRPAFNRRTMTLDAVA